ncbi:MAG: ABC transporter permease [Nitrososphaerales archaeon]|nr:ABC transporter permease [Nitrososphaerales archaeon]
MSRIRTIRLVAKKETVDMLRDRRTIITALVVPLLSFPILFGVIGYFGNPTSNPSPVLLVNADGGDVASAVQVALASTPGLTMSTAQSGNITSAVQSGTYDIGLVIPTGFSAAVDSGRRSNVTAYYDPANNRAQLGASLISGVIASVSNHIASTRLQQKGVTQADLNPIGVLQVPVGKVIGKGASIAASLFPSFLLYFTFLGGFYFMVDDIAGEKERRSLEALFTLPPSRTDIFLGKYLVAFALSMITAVLGLVGTLFSISEIRFGGAQGSPLISYGAFPVVLGIMAMAALSLSAVGFCVSTFAKNVREAQQYLSPIFLVLFIPLYVSSFLPPSQLSQYAAIPVLGYTLLLRDVVVGAATAGEAALSIGVNLVFLAVVIWLGLRLLNSEKIILRTS